MSYKDKLKTERCIEILSKVSVFLYIIAALEIVAYVFGIKISFIDFRAIAIEIYAVYVACTLLLAVGIAKLSNKIKEDFIKKLKYRN